MRDEGVIGWLRGSLGSVFSSAILIVQSDETKQHHISSPIAEIRWAKNIWDQIYAVVKIWLSCGPLGRWILVTDNVENIQ